MTVLQKFGFKDSPYQRPHDKWVCGHLAEGKPCPLGPDMHGKCGAKAACEPHLEDGRWQCRRSALEGGPCEKGPLPDGRCCLQQEPCVPQPSLRTRRGRMARWAAALAVGLVVLIVASSQAGRFLMPGPLTSAHASLTNCDACHAGVKAEKLGWLHSFAATTSAKENANLCVACHNVGDAPFSPHTNPVERLEKLTAAYQAGPDGRTVQNDSWVHRISFPPPKQASGQTEIFCATCHQEHEGGIHDLTTVSNLRCQTCHVSKFEEFVNSHPQFTNFPFNRRTRIIFDHKSHFGTHFPKTAETNSSSVPGTCMDCHVPGKDQRYMEVRAFDTMCSSCHEGDILGTTRVSGPKGINFLAVPGLDVATLKERHVDIGDWPEYSEARLTAFMKALLAKNTSGQGIADQVAQLDLLDLTEASDEDLAKVADLAWSVKGLFSRFENDGIMKAMHMPADDSGTDMNRLDMSYLTGLISHDVIASANRDWFPNLQDDLHRHNNGQPTTAFEAWKKAEEEAAAEAAKKQAAAAAEKTSSSSSGQDADDGSILGGDDTGSDGDILGSSDDLAGGNDGGTDLLGQPAGADEIGTDLLSPPAGADEADAGLLSQPAGADEEPAEEAQSGGDSLAGNDSPSSDDILSGGGTGPAEDTDSILGGSSDSDGDDILSGDSGGGDILSGDNLSTDGGGADILSGDMLSGDGGGAGGLEVADTDSDAQPAESRQTPFDPEVWAELGGWYRQDYTIRYRPMGHADRFLRSWLDYAGSAFGTDRQGMLAPIFDQLASSDAVGRCTKCHSVDDDAGTQHVKWKPFNSSRVKDRFTKFSHEPHIDAVGDKGCRTCHELDPAPDTYLETYKGNDPAVFSPVFAPIEKNMCTDCHTDEAAGETCTLCHNYHATQFGRPLVPTKLP
ncbi:hypothetical protein [Roseibium sp.]|uniref:hypothetical protein n=1 Tax=Roseibium sp. TaxID=1936156 RepID=UPI003A97BE72